MPEENEQELVVKSQLEKATTKLTKVASDADKALAGVVDTITEQVEVLSEQITEKSVALKALDAELEEKKSKIATELSETKKAAKTEKEEYVRAQKVERDLDVKENEDKALNELLKSKNLEAFEAGTVEYLKADLDAALASNEDAITSAVNAAKAIAETESENKLKVKELEYAAETAKKDADLNAANSTIETLNAQISTLNSQISELRQSMEKMITGQSAPVINVDKK